MPHTPKAASTTAAQEARRAAIVEVMTFYDHDPDAVLDYTHDFSPELASGETVVSHLVIVSAGLTLDSHSEDAGVVTARISGATANSRQSVTFRVTTSAGRTLNDHTDYLVVADL